MRFKVPIWGTVNWLWRSLSFLLMPHILPTSAKRPSARRSEITILSYIMLLPGPLSQRKHYEIVTLLSTDPATITTKWKFLGGALSCSGGWITKYLVEAGMTVGCATFCLLTLKARKFVHWQRKLGLKANRSINGPVQPKITSWTLIPHIFLHSVLLAA